MRVWRRRDSKRARNIDYYKHNEDKQMTGIYSLLWLMCKWYFQQYYNYFGIECIFEFLAVSSKRWVNETLLREVLRKIFPAANIRINSCYVSLWNIVEIEYNVKKKANIKNPHSERYLELDIWLPEYQLCFEFQVTSNLFIKPLQHNIGRVPLQNNMVHSTFSRSYSIQRQYEKGAHLQEENYIDSSSLLVGWLSSQVFRIY